MDLKKLDVVAMANKGTVLELKSPFDFTDSDTGKDFLKGDVLTDKDGKAFSIKLLGSDSNTYRNGIKAKLQKRINKGDDKREKVDLDHEQLKAAELMAKCTTDCYFIEDGKPVSCTASEMTRIYMTYPWIREQAEAFMADRSALTKG